VQEGAWRVVRLQQRAEVAASEQALQHPSKLSSHCRGLSTACILRAEATGTAPPAIETKDTKDSNKDDDKPISWARFFLYIGSGISGLIFLYYFRKANYSLHQTEVLLLEKMRRLPLYPPPQRSAGEQNGKLDGCGLPPDLVIAFAEWFVHTDLQEAGGVVRDDVLEICKELGLDDEHKAAKDFLMRGEGQIEEKRRLTGAGLQESVTLLSKMALPEDGSPCLVGEAGVALLRSRLPQRGRSVMDSAIALQQLQGGGAVPGDGAGRVAPPPTAALPSLLPKSQSSSVAATAAAASEESVGAVEESELRRLEDARLARVEEGLLARLTRQGTLSPAEEARLQNVREQRSKL